MKREDVKKQIPGITEEQLDWIMTENGADINREKTAAEQYRTQLTTAQAQLKTAQDGLAAFDGKRSPRSTKPNWQSSRAICRLRLRALPLTMP